MKNDQPSGFSVVKTRYYHLPHNAVLVEEFDFFVSLIDFEKKSYTAQELQKLFLIGQITSNKFKKFHLKQYKGFTEDSPPDKDKHRKIFDELETARECPRNVIPEIYDKTQTLGSEKALEWFLGNKLSAYKLFVSNPQEYYGEFMDTYYTTRKPWKRLWAETVRDYIQFMSYIGIIPAYYKGWGFKNRTNIKTGFVPAKLGRQYSTKKVSLAKLLMGYKYRNALIDLINYGDYNRKVRPFFVALKLLHGFKQEGIESIERNLLAGFVSCIREENEVDEIVRKYAFNLRENSQNRLQDVFEVDKGFLTEIGRFALPLTKFLFGTELVRRVGSGSLTYLSITELGSKTYLGEPKKIAVFNDNIGEFKLTPIVGYVLKFLADKAKIGSHKINFRDVYGHHLESLINREQFEELLRGIQQMSPKAKAPIEKFDKSTICLRDLSCQYSINSSTDFSRIEDSDFVEGIPQPAYEPEIIKIEKSETLEDTIDCLRTVACGSDGEAYETALYGAISNLIGETCVHQFGNKGARAQRVSDVVWEVPILANDEKKTLLVVFEAKSGKAILAFDERKEVDNLRRTVERFKSEWLEVAGIWYIVVDGESLPESKHGGHRGGGVSFKQKLAEIQNLTLQRFTKPVLVSAMNIHSFIEYYRYLFWRTRGFGKTFDSFNSSFISEFWMWGKLFHPVRSYDQVFNDSNWIKQNLQS